MIKISKQINLNSSSANITNFPLNSVLNFNLDGLLNPNNTPIYRDISIVHAEIPVSYYIVNENNNLFVLRENGVIREITLILGNYNAISFKTMLLILINTNGFTYELTFNNSTGKYSFTGFGANQFQIFESTTCNILLGLQKQITYTSVDNVLIAPFVANFLGATQIKIKSQAIQTENLDSASRGSDNIFAIIQVATPAFGLINYMNITDFKNKLLNSSLNSIDITVTDGLNNILNFNGVHLSLTVVIDEFYNDYNFSDKNSLTELIKKE